MILGTPTYMSPEQARGKAVDKRTDIWAFGCVLYECLTGKRAFAGEAFGELIAAILAHEVDLDALPSSTPTHVRRLLARTLVKDPRSRLRDIGEARVMLASPAEAVPLERRGAWKLFSAAAAGLVLGALAGSYVASRPRAATQPVPVSGPAAFRQVTDLPGQEREPSLSPDGKSVVYASKSSGNWDIFLQRVGGRTPINLTADSLDDDSAPAFSPDGESIAFRSERSAGGVFVMGATGESVRRVADFGYAPAWSPDGSRLALATEPVDDPLSREGISELWVVTLDGSEKRRLTAGDAVGASWSPDGQRIAYWGWRDPDWQRDLWTIAADGSEPRGVLVTDDPPVDWSPVWTSDGRGLYFGSNRGGTMNLWRIEVDPRSGLPGGPPVPVTTPSPWSGSFSLSADGGRLVYATRDEQTSVMTVGFDPEAGALAGEPQRIFGGRALIELDWSPDGERLILTQRGDPWESIAIIRSDGTGYTRITDASIQHRSPRWCPLEGSERILIYSNASVMSLRTDGSGLKPLGEGERSAQAAWSADGRSVLALLQDERWLASELVRFDVDEDGNASRAGWPPLAVEGRGIGWLCDWSRDGARALCCGRFPNPGLHVVDLGTGESRKIADYGTVFPGGRWLPDGRRALVRVSNQLFLFDVETLEQELLLEAGSESRVWGGAHSLTPDGKKLAYLVPQGEGDVWSMDLAGARD
jgi:Tol biopolymer transport system component